MTEFVRELFANGKVTIPRELRGLYDLKDGDLVTLKIVQVMRASDRVSPSSPTVPVSSQQDPEQVKP